MSAAAIGPVKAMTLALDAGKLSTGLDRRLDASDGGADLRGWLRDFAEAEDVPY
jgi:phosphotransferase system enzyme I (PtsP)